jgi:phytoene/squalene synthetase
LTGALAEPDVVRRLHDSVARQHALLVELLPDPIKRWSMSYYLLFRVIDTVEDCDAPLAGRLRILDAIAENPLAGLDGARGLPEIAPGLSRPYARLLRRLDAVLAAHGSISPMARTRIEETARWMAGGMARLLRLEVEAHASGRQRFLSDMAALEDYCRVAAGCVGELNADLFHLGGAISVGRSLRIREAAGELGIYLQVVNVIRDRARDAAARGKNLFPASIATLPETDQLRAILDFGRKREPAIRDLIESLQGASVRAYCETLFEVARLHYDFYAETPEVLLGPVRPPLHRMLAVLPWSLRAQFAAFQTGRFIERIKEKNPIS